VQKAADRVRVNVQLINAQYDSHLWADTFDRKLTDLFAVESEIAAKIADTLQAKLTAPERRAIAARPTENGEAHDLYLKGRYYVEKYTEEGIRTGIAYFQQAIDLDSNYAPAYSGIAYAHFTATDFFVAPRESMPKMSEAARKALELDDTLPEAHMEMGIVHFMFDFD
jgi:adenylate cyclase